MEFQISENELKKIEALSKMVSGFKLDESLYVMKAEQERLYAILYNNGLVAKFSIAIQNLSEDAFFYVDIAKLIQIASNVFISSKAELVNVSVDKNKIIAFAGKSKATIPLLDEEPTENEYEETFKAFDKKTDLLFKDYDNVEVTPFIVNFASVMSKYISLFSSMEDVSGIAVEGNMIKYSDQRLTIFKMPTDSTICSKKHVIPQMLFSVLSSISKSIADPSFAIQFSSDEKFVRCDVPSLSLQFIMSMPLAVCEFPEDEDYKYIAPDPENCISFKVDKSILFEKLRSFDGIFASSSWKWKSVDFLAYPENKDSIMLRHVSDTGEIEVDLPAYDLIGMTEDDAKFKISVSMLQDYLKNFSDNDEVKFSFLNHDPDGDIPHSIGIEVSSGKCTFLLGKIEEDEILGI